MNAKTCLALFLTALLLPACYRIVREDSGFDFQKAPAEAGRLLSLVEQRNNAVSSFKGIGKISVWDADGSRTSRAAWLGTADGRLRIEFLGLPGQPVARFIFDGSRYSFLSYVDQQLYQQTDADPDLAQVTGVSIKTSELTEYLAGGMPVYAHDSVSLESGEAEGRSVLVFTKNWLGEVEKIFFNGFVPERVEIFKWGKKAYQVEFNDIRTVNDRPIPFHVVITNADQHGFSFAADRLWSDIEVPPSAFEITPKN